MHYGGQLLETTFDCVACMAKQAVKIAEEFGGPYETNEKILRACLRVLSEADYKTSSPAISYLMQTEAKSITGISDPYEQLKIYSNEISRKIVEQIESEGWIKSSSVEREADDFDTACRLAIAGNIIDYSAGIDVNYDTVLTSVKKSMAAELHGVSTKSLLKKISESKKIMYILDNAGEVFFDRFLLEQINNEKLTLVVKGGPIVNDATLFDAEAAGLQHLVHRIIDTGHNSQGVIRAYCSDVFWEAFNASDLIISKGMANFETLYRQTDKEIFFLFRAKCDRIADVIGCKKMDYVIVENT